MPFKLIIIVTDGRELLFLKSRFPGKFRALDDISCNTYDSAFVEIFSEDLSQ